MQLTLESPVQYIPRVGPAKAKLLENLGIYTVSDLLWHIPFRYDDFSVISKIKGVTLGEVVTIKGTVISMKNSFTKTGKKLQQARIADETGTMDIIWFNQMYLTNIIKEGMILQLSGKNDWFGTKRAMISPEYEFASGKSLHTGRIVPVYNETEGISSKWLRGRIDFVLQEIADSLSDIIPEHVRKNLPDLKTAIQTVHFPKDHQTAIRAKNRLAFDELFLLLLSSYQQKRRWEQTKISHQINATDVLIRDFISSLPFTLTQDQQTTLQEMVADIKKTIPMNRMLEGDVGAGKTVIAAAGIFASFMNGFSAILMAPTQILAQQHYKTISSLLAPFNIAPKLVVGGSEILEKSKIPQILVGTHALLSEARTFTNVGFLAIDEQQRFGVKQRLLLRTKYESATSPHVLTMTATPIPRTIAQIIFGNLDLSILSTLPSGRLPVKTWVVPTQKRASAYQWIRKQLKEHHTQAFIVCPIIDESESMTDVKAVKKEYLRLKKEIFPDFKLGLLHGQMKNEEKTKVMKQFENHSIDMLVTTPVVEVGIDIKNASIMLIEAAERFGLSQLHQLRGRVGRGDKQSYCLLFTENDLALKRLKALETIHNGPRLAELDLSLRGPGDILGTRQHGIPNLKIADFSNLSLIREVQQSVQKLTAEDPDLVSFPLLRAKLEKSTIEATQD